MSNGVVTTAVCKTLQSLGLSPRKEHQIENALVRQIESSGPEFVLSRLGTLSDWRKMHMRGEVSYHPEWFRFKNHDGCCTPADSIGSQLWALKDKTFFAVVGALRKSVELSIPSEKQLMKWLDGVRCENMSDPNFHLKPFGAQALDGLEKRLVAEWANRPWFNVSDVTGTNVPGSGKFMKVNCEKQEVNGKVVKTQYLDPRSLLAAYEFSASTAPLFIWQFLDDIDAPTRMGEGLDDSEAVIGSLRNLINDKLSSPSLLDEALMGSSPVFDDEFASTCDLVTHRLGFAHSVGNIGFLEQEGGKLRTVANPNRLVQWANIPLGNVLSHLQRINPDSYVYCQEDGMNWAQTQLQKGISLSSFDMSSATDRLDFSKWLDEKFCLLEKYPDRWTLLRRSLDLFRDTAAAPWSIPGHVADLIGAKVNEISWSVGQPLGLRPSFPTLTLMNSDFAKAAIMRVDGKFEPGHFACVGDDLIIETKYASAYMDVVACYNGKINNDKTMVSDRYAEFCSHLVTRSTIFPLKPRWVMELEGSVQNVEKFTTSGLTPKVQPWVYDLHNDIARYAIKGSVHIPYSVTSGPLSLNTRVAVNTLLAACHPGSRDSDYVTLQTLFMRAMENENKLGPVRWLELGSTSAEGAYPAFGGQSANPCVDLKYEGQSFVSNEILGSISTDKSTSVEVPVKQDWDYRENRYKVPSSKLSSDKALARKLKRIDISEGDGLVEACIRKDNVETRVVVDTNPESPQALVAHRVFGRGSQSVKTVETVQDLLLDEPVLTALYSRRPTLPNEVEIGVDTEVLEDDILDLC